MSKEKRGIRDGSGSYKDSFQKSNSVKGKRQEKGERCPVLPKSANKANKK